MFTVSCVFHQLLEMGFRVAHPINLTSGESLQNAENSANVKR